MQNERNGPPRPREIKPGEDFVVKVTWPNETSLVTFPTPKCYECGARGEFATPKMMVPGKELEIPLAALLKIFPPGWVVLEGIAGDEPHCPRCAGVPGSLDGVEES